MSDLMRILDIAKRALNAHQNAMNVYSNNIANVNTVGYSRQRITLTQSRSVSFAKGLLGTGVNVGRIESIRSKFVLAQLISERPSLNQFEFKETSFQLIEDIFTEPSDFGLNRMMSDFFNAFNDLANDPESAAARSVVREKAITLTGGFKRISGQLNDLQAQLNTELKDKVAEVNRLSKQIAHLNDQIVTSEVGGREAMAMRDERNLLIDRLSELVNIQTNENQAGSVNISMGGRFLVTDTQAQKLSLKSQSVDDAGPRVVWERDGEVANITNGTIKGILDIRDVNVSDYLGQLDEVAVTLAQEMNKIHTQGYNLGDATNINFFDPNVTGADDLALSSEILDNANLIATSDAAGEPGNNNIVLALAGLQDAKVMSNGQFSISDFYNSLIATVGSQGQEAQFLQRSFGLTVEKLEFTRDSVSAVSLDEEMVNMIEAQQAYTAAARIITTVDEMIQTILNMV